MKRKLFSLSIAATVVAVAMLNYRVVFNKESGAIVKVDRLNDVYADGSSSSGYDPSAAYNEEWADDPSNVDGYYDDHGWVPPGKKRKISKVFNGITVKTGNPRTSEPYSETMRGDGQWKITLGGKLAQTQTSSSSSSSSSGSGGSGEVSVATTFEFGKSYIVNLTTTKCDGAHSERCEEFNTFISKSEI